MFRTVTSHDGQLMRFTSSTVSLHTEQPALKFSTFLDATITFLLQKCAADASWTACEFRFGPAPNKGREQACGSQPGRWIRIQKELSDHDEQRGERSHHERGIAASPCPAEKHGQAHDQSGGV